MINITKGKKKKFSLYNVLKALVKINPNGLLILTLNVKIGESISKTPPKKINFIVIYRPWKWKSDVTCGHVWWPILGISALHLSHLKCTHTAVNTHTHTPWTHTRSSGLPFMLRRPGSSWGFGALLKDTSVVVLKEERALYIHSPHLQFLSAWDSNPQPLDYESNSLTIRPRLPLNKMKTEI